MAQLDSNRIAQTILSASIVTRLALAVSNPKLRERAAYRLAQVITGEQVEPNPDQLTLPIE